MKKKEKGRKWDGRSRPSTDLYKKNWNEIFGNKNVVVTEPSFVSRDYSNEDPDNTINNNDGTRTDKVSDKSECHV